MMDLFLMGKMDGVNISFLKDIQSSCLSDNFFQTLNSE